jgi:hypothetical protein
LLFKISLNSEPGRTPEPNVFYYYYYYDDDSLDNGTNPKPLFSVELVANNAGLFFSAELAANNPKLFFSV